MNLDPISRWAQTVNWDAWAAVGTVGAVMLALVAAGRSAREARARDIARLTAMRAILVGLCQMIDGSVERAATHPAVEAKGIHRTGLLQMHMEALDRIDLYSLPKAEAVDAFLTVRSQIHMIAETAGMVVEGSVTPETFAAALRRSAKHLHDQRNCFDQMEYALRHPLRSILQKVMQSGPR